MHTFFMDEVVTNTSHPAVRSALVRILEFWIQSYRSGSDYSGTQCNGLRFKLVSYLTLSAAHLGTGHIPDFESTEGLRDLITLGNMVLFTKALDIRQYDGTNPPKQPEVDRLQQLYVSFSRWYMENYRVQEEDEGDGDGLNVFASAAMDFAFEVYKYYMVCVREKRSSIGDTVKAAPLRMALRSPLKYFGPEVCQRFAEVCQRWTGAAEEDIYEPLNFDDILIQRRDRLSSAGSASQLGKRKHTGKMSGTVVDIGELLRTSRVTEPEPLEEGEIPSSDKRVKTASVVTPRPFAVEAGNLAFLGAQSLALQLWLACSRSEALEFTSTERSRHQVCALLLLL
jgi:hypothetical protein